MIRYIFLFFVALFVMGCNQNSTMALPEQMPADFRLVYRIDGGMSDYRAEVIVFNDSIFLNMKNDTVRIQKAEKLLPGQFGDLYKLLKTEEVHALKHHSVKDKIDQRGGRILKLSWEKNELLLKDAENNFIAEEHFERWLRITNQIETLAGLAK